MRQTPAEHRPRALLLYGGWDGHRPDQAADFAEQSVLRPAGFEVVRSRDLADLRPGVLAAFDLLVPIWTFGELSEAQERGLLDGVAAGTGLLAWHGWTSAFLGSRPHKFLTGGQFVHHPGGETVTYTVRFRGDHPLVAGLADVTVTSEQYYHLIDPAVTVLASSQIVGEGMDWVAGVEMPAVWCRRWGAGRVFYCALGHTVEILAHPTVTELLCRAARWAGRAAAAVPATPAPAPRSR